MFKERTADPPEVVEQLAATVESLLEETITALNEMREREGQHLRVDLDGRRETLAGLDRVGSTSRPPRGARAWRRGWPSESGS